MDTYIGLTLRREIIEKDGLSIDLEALGKMAVEAIQYRHRHEGKISRHIFIERVLPSDLEVEEYIVRSETDLRIKLSMEPENYAPFNCWVEVSGPGSNEWTLLCDLASHLSTSFTDFTFIVNSSFCFVPNCPKDERFLNLFRNGDLFARLTHHEWIRSFLNTKLG
jgi:hypothetical protein